MLPACFLKLYMLLNVRNADMNNLTCLPYCFLRIIKNFNFFLLLTPCVKHNFLARQRILQHKSEKKKKCDYVIILSSFFLIFFPSFISREYWCFNTHIYQNISLYQYFLYFKKVIKQIHYTCTYIHKLFRESN